MYSKDEMETLIRYDYATDTTYVSTNVRKHMTLFQKKGWTVTRQEVEDESVTFMEFESKGSAFYPKNANAKPRKAPSNGFKPKNAM